MFDEELCLLKIVTVWGFELGGQCFADAEPVTHLSWSGSAGFRTFRLFTC